LETVFYPVALKDALEIVTSHSADAPPVIFTSSGLSIAGPTEGNLCIKAYNLLKTDFPELIPAVKMHLHKHIPMGAGLGGGSSNGAFTLTLLNQLYHLELSAPQLEAYALQLGSDCPFFIGNKPAFAAGRGELLQPLSLDLGNYHLLLVNPGIHVSTAAAFGGIVPKPSANNLVKVISEPLESWKTAIVNDFEASVFRVFPEISDLREKLYGLGAVYASMSGTGSTVYGIFKNQTAVELPAEYFHQWIRL
jgi:4-diphosphocytidyl-2-C-methyl-D-erythritol kinase